MFTTENPSWRKQIPPKDIAGMIEGTIDCQEARNRIGGYLSGTVASDEAIELESHMDECIDCRMAFEHRRESQAAMRERERAAIDFERISQEAESVQTRSIASALRKQSLQQMLRVTETEAEPATVRVEPVESEPVAVATEPAIESLTLDADLATPVKVRRQWKSVAYTVALVSVLAAAILVSANSGAIFESKPPVREPGSVHATPPDRKPENIASNPVPTATELAAASAVEPSYGPLAGETIGANQGLTLSTAKPIAIPEERSVTRSPIAKKANRKRPVRKARRSASPQQGVRVYNP